MVLFTNFSATETCDSSGDISYDDEEDEGNGAISGPIDPSGDSLNFTLLINKFREDLVTKLMEDQSLKSKFDAQKIVDKCLP